MNFKNKILAASLAERFCKKGDEQDFLKLFFMFEKINEEKFLDILNDSLKFEKLYHLYRKYLLSLEIEENERQCRRHLKKQAKEKELSIVEEMILWYLVKKIFLDDDLFSLKPKPKAVSKKMSR